MSHIKIPSSPHAGLCDRTFDDRHSLSHSTRVGDLRVKEREKRQLLNSMGFLESISGGSESHGYV